MRFEAEGVDEDASVLVALVVVGPVGELSASSVPREVSVASVADDGAGQRCAFGCGE